MTDFKSPPAPLSPGPVLSGEPGMAAPVIPTPDAPLRSPGFAGFIKRRFSSREFMGFPLTLLVCGVLSLPLFHALVALALGSRRVMALNQTVSEIMLSWRLPFWVDFMIWPTYMTNRFGVASLTITMLIVFWLLKRKSYMIPFSVSVLVGALAKLLGSTFFPVTRPSGGVYATERSLSFPSGHSIQSLACYGFICYFLWRTCKNRFGRALILLLSLAIPFAVGFSRVYLGVHFASDVWIGLLMGAVCLAVGISISEWRFHHVAPEPPAIRRSLPVKLAVAGVLTLELISFIFMALRFKATVPEVRTAARAVPEVRAPAPPAAEPVEPAQPQTPHQ